MMNCISTELIGLKRKGVKWTCTFQISTSIFPTRHKFLPPNILQWNCFRLLLGVTPKRKQCLYKILGSKQSVNGKCESGDFKRREIRHSNERYWVLLTWIVLSFTSILNTYVVWGCFNNFCLNTTGFLNDWRCPKFYLKLNLKAYISMWQTATINTLCSD